MLRALEPHAVISLLCVVMRQVYLAVRLPRLILKSSTTSFKPFASSIPNRSIAQVGHVCLCNWNSETKVTNVDAIFELGKIRGEDDESKERRRKRQRRRSWGRWRGWRGDGFRNNKRKNKWIRQVGQEKRGSVEPPNERLAVRQTVWNRALGLGLLRPCMHSLAMVRVGLVPRPMPDPVTNANPGFVQNGSGTMPRRRALRDGNSYSPAVVVPLRGCCIPSSKSWGRFYLLECSENESYANALI